MSPRRPDPSVVEARTTAMSTLLDTLAEVEVSDLEHDTMTRLAVERILTQLVELASSVNEHVGGALTRRAATSYKDSFVLATECGLIDEELRDELLPSVGMRNVLVHEYLDIDLGKVAAAVPLALDVYRRYVRTVAAFVDDLDL